MSEEDLAFKGGADGAPIRLRPHHLWCMLTFVGVGYTPAFTARMRATLARLAAAAPVEIVDGPDTLCAPLLDDPSAHCRRASVTARDARARQAAEAVLARPLPAGAQITLTGETIARLRAAFAAGAASQACAGCPWTGFCTEIAARGFTGAVLPGSTPPDQSSATPPPPPPDARTPARASAPDSDRPPGRCETAPAWRNPAQRSR